jgi:hypothetical protein
MDTEAFVNLRTVSANDDVRQKDTVKHMCHTIMEVYKLAGSSMLMPNCERAIKDGETEK